MSCGRILIGSAVAVYIAGLGCAGGLLVEHVRADARAGALGGVLGATGSCRGSPAWWTRSRRRRPRGCVGERHRPRWRDLRPTPAPPRGSWPGSPSSRFSTRIRGRPSKKTVFAASSAPGPPTNTHLRRGDAAEYKSRLATIAAARSCAVSSRACTRTAHGTRGWPRGSAAVRSCWSRSCGGVAARSAHLPQGALDAARGPPVRSVSTSITSAASMKRSGSSPRSLPATTPSGASNGSGIRRPRKRVRMPTEAGMSQSAGHAVAKRGHRGSRINADEGAAMSISPAMATPRAPSTASQYASRKPGAAHSVPSVFSR